MSKEPNHLFHEISNLSTEQRNEKSKDIDFASTAEILKIINNEEDDKNKIYYIGSDNHFNDKQ